jgi:hypothetical protein
MQQVKISLYIMHDFFKALTYHSFTLFPSAQFFSIFARPAPLTSVSQTIFSSVAKFIVPDWGI